MITKKSSIRYSLGHLDAQRKYNYQKAENFYKLRMNNFRTYMENRLIEGEENFIDYLNKAINDKWKNVITKQYWDMINSIEKGDKIDFSTSSESDYEKTLTLSMAAKFAEKPKSKPSSILGYGYEEFIDKVIEDYGKNMANTINNTINQLLSILYVGTKTSTSATVSGQKSIRPDFIMGITSNDLTYNNGSLQANGLDVELQSLIDLSSNSKTINAILENKALAYNTAGLYGFSVKAWSNSGIFMHSSQMQEILNSAFLNRDPQGSRYAWQKDYITSYMLWKLSCYIINIIGPVDVGLITSSGFIGFDTWLSNHLFYMDVQIDDVRDRKSGWGLPEVKNSAVKARMFSHESMVMKSYIGAIKDKTTKQVIDKAGILRLRSYKKR